MTADILIRNARPMGGKPVDLVIRDGRFSAAGDRPEQEIDASGHIALPGLVEAHTHLDKTLIGMDWFENRIGPTRNERILADRKAKRELTINARQQSARQIMQTLQYGVLHIRSHVDVDTTIVDGRVLMRGRKLLHQDEGAILNRAEKAFRLAMKRAGLA